MEIQQKTMKRKLELLKMGNTSKSVSEACREKGYSRDSFYRFERLFKEGRLKETVRRKANLENRVDGDIENAVVAMATEYPAYGQRRVSGELEKSGLVVSPGGVRCVWLRHGLESFEKRVNALKAELAKKGLIPTEAQLAALKRARDEKLAVGETKSRGPGNPGTQDTFYVGNVKGIGRVYQQTFIDSYSGVAIVGLYGQKDASVAVSFLDSRVLPFVKSRGFELRKILTDHGREYCGREYYGIRRDNKYQLYLKSKGIEHKTTTKARSTQTNKICESFHKTIHKEFYREALKKAYRKLDDLQDKVDNWVNRYNSKLPPEGGHRRKTLTTPPQG